MIKLGVNIDHSATLRQARYRDVVDNKIIVEPSPLAIALAAERGGADSITAHLREDRRHILDNDIIQLRKNIATKLNLEMACTPEITAFAVDIKPDYVCLVPENRMEVTTEGGLNVKSNLKNVENTVRILSDANIICSIFIDPDIEQIQLAQKIGAPTIELHTGAYANSWGYPTKKKEELERIAKAADYAKSLGLTVNSGHGINYSNVQELIAVSDFNELNIGHTIICRSLLVGVETAVKEMKELLSNFAIND